MTQAPTDEVLGEVVKVVHVTDEAVAQHLQHVVQREVVLLTNSLQPLLRRLGDFRVDNVFSELCHSYAMGLLYFH